MMDFLPAILLLVFLSGIGILFFGRKKRLTLKNFDMAAHRIKNTHNLDPAHAILEAHKIFVAAIKTLASHHERMTAAKAIEKVADRFKNTDRVWHFHKLRNQVAHEPEIKITYEQAHQARHAFIRALSHLR